MESLFFRFPRVFFSLSDMNLDALSIALARISFLIENLTEKNLSNSSDEISRVGSSLSSDEFGLFHLSS